MPQEFNFIFRSSLTKYKSFYTEAMQIKHGVWQYNNSKVRTWLCGASFRQKGQCNEERRRRTQQHEPSKQNPTVNITANLLANVLRKSTVWAKTRGKRNLAAVRQLHSPFPSLFSFAHRRARWTSRLLLQFTELQNDGRDHTKARTRSYSLFQVVRRLQKWLPAMQICPSHAENNKRTRHRNDRKQWTRRARSKCRGAVFLCLTKFQYKGMLQPKTKESRANTKDRHHKIQRPITQKPDCITRTTECSGQRRKWWTQKDQMKKQKGMSSKNGKYLGHEERRY